MRALARYLRRLADRFDPPRSFEGTTTTLYIDGKQVAEAVANHPETTIWRHQP